MKTKLLKLMGVALTVVLLASLTVGLAGVPAGAASSNLKFVKLELPQVEDYGTWTSYGAAIDPDEFADSEGDFWCTPAADLGPIAQTPDGDMLFAAVADGFYYSSAWFHVLKSTDGGYSWTVTGYYDDVITGYGDTSPIVDIVTSPEYDDDTTLAVATMSRVYISDDSGKNFTQLSTLWGGATIMDMDMTIAEDGDLAIMVGTSTGGAGGDVYVAKGLLSWTPQLIGTYDVLACAFLPTFADDGDIGICAIVTEYSFADPVDTNGPGSTFMMFSFANVADGGEWGADIKNAPFTNASGLHFASDAASIAFPDDFDAFGIGNNVCFAGIVQDGYLGALDLDEENGSDAYKVQCKEAGTSSTTDLDVRGVITTLLPTATAIISIDVCGNADEATILVGTDAINLGDTPAYFSAYTSDDSGETWVPSRKCPTGGLEGAPNAEYERVNTRVMMAPDFCDSGLAYASTWGYMTDAFQRTTNGGESFNQISIIDYGYNASIPGPDYTITGFDAYGYVANDTLWMITQVNANDGAFWGLLDGKHWERLLSYATPGVTDTLKRLDILGDGSAIFASDLTSLSIWRSTDMGATFPKKITTKAVFRTLADVSSTTLYTGNVGEIWWSTRSGTGWTKPDDSEIPATAPIINVGVKGDVVTIGAIGGVFISSNGGKTVQRVGTTGPFGGPTIVTASGDTLYATSPISDKVMRTVVDLANPNDAEWVQIDDYQDSTGATVYDETTFVAGGPAIALPPNGILYVVDATAVNDSPYTGGLWRSTNPTADTDSVVPPYFERENKGLDGGETLGFLCPSLAPPTLAPTFFCSDSSATNYWEQVWMFTDILNIGVTPASPEKDATGVGLLPEGYVYPEVTLLWQEMAGATRYEVQVSIDANFKTIVEDWFTNSLASPSLKLDPNTTYYWRLRVAGQTAYPVGTLIGTPLISPWSEVWKFKTAIGASMARPDLQAPWPGEPDVPLSPTFEWSGIEWAETYEYELALDPTTTAGGYFSTPLVALVGPDALVSTAWKSDTTLDYETRYYWHVKAIGVDTDTPWSDVGTFTTMSKAAPPPSAQPPVVIPPAEQITPAWIWAIVIIGAILVIAVIVLIVTTRRVP